MTTEAQTQLHTPPSPSNIRPKGILKNSYHRSPPQQAPITTTPPPQISPIPQARPDLTAALSDKDITLANTAKNAGHRRSSSDHRPVSTRSRQSSNGNLAGLADADEQSMRLKWDEANLYLTEQEKNSTMKIDEPKTPYARQYDPAEDEDEVRALDADEIMVDELEFVRGKKSSKARDEEIPGLSLGEPEEAIPEHEFDTEGKRKVHVSGDDHVGLSKEELEKHRKFEEMRKKHYEMKNVANLLGHPEELDDIDDDGDEDMNGNAR